MKRTRVLKFRVSDEERAALWAMSRATGKTVSELIREAVLAPRKM